jgi:hypothetical protein
MSNADLLRLHNEPTYQVEHASALEVSTNLDKLTILSETDVNALTALDLYSSLQKTIEFMNHPFRREKILSNREAILSGKNRFPTQNTLTTLMREQEKEPWNIWNIFSILRAQKKENTAKNKLFELAPDLDGSTIPLEDISFIEGSGMIAVIQSGGLNASQAIIKNASEAIWHAHLTFDYQTLSTRTVRSQQDIQDSIKLSLQAIQPMYNEVLIHLNGILGPTNRKYNTI